MQDNEEALSRNITAITLSQFFLLNSRNIDIYQCRSFVVFIPLRRYPVMGFRQGRSPIWLLVGPAFFPSETEGLIVEERLEQSCYQIMVFDLKQKGRHFCRPLFMLL
jgi:hypothetical protein